MSDLKKNIIKIGKQAKGASLLLSKISSKQKNNAIEAMADNIINNKISAFDSDFSYESEEQIFKPNSKALNELSNNIKSCGMELSANSIYNAYNLLIYKKDFFAQRWIIVDSEGGAIQNEELKYNGMCYFRRIVEKNEDIIEESICVKML